MTVKSGQKTIRIADFKKTMFEILSEYDGKKCNIMIAGGSLLSVLDSPAYTALNTKDWNIFFADERCNHNHRNYDAALETFLRHVKGRSIPIQADMPAKEAVEDYDRKLTLLSKEDGDRPIHVCLLGIGDNGHICSLWPDSPELDCNENVTFARVECPLSPERISITLHYINNSISQLFFVLPPKNGKPKDIKEPHKSIRDRLTLPYTILLPM